MIKIQVVAKDYKILREYYEKDIPENFENYVENENDYFLRIFKNDIKIKVIYCYTIKLFTYDQEKS